MEPKTEVSDVITSWHFDPDTKANAPLQGQKYVLLPASPLDKAKVVGYYLPHPVPGYSIKQVEVIYNPKFNRSFSLQLDKLEERHDNSAFKPKWSTMAHASLRQQTYDTFLRLTTPYTDTHYPHVKLLPVWHGTKPEVLDSIFRAGYANLATTDAGFFGKGYYSALEAEYAARVYSEGALLLNWVACFSPLPIVEDDMQALELVGRANYGNYDAHFIPVISKNPKNPHDTSYFPCTAQQKAQYHEFVVFESVAILPRYLVQLQPNHVKTPSFPEIPGEAVYVKGLQAFHHAHYLQAKACFEDAAAKAYPAAYLWLGRLYHFGGYIGPKNETLKEQWYDKVRTNIDWFHAQAQTGRADAYFNLGRCYDLGIGVEKNEVEAVRYFCLAAEQGFALAQCNLGWCYEYGTGVEKNEKEAVRYYRLAADQGDANAQCRLGVCYKFGMGVEKDVMKAVHYYQLAADQGDADAQRRLGVCYQFGTGVEKNEVEAVRYYQLAAEQGHANAQRNLGLCYEFGKGVEKDEKEAVRYYQLAADQGDAGAQRNLGLCYEFGKGVEKDEKEAVRYYQLAADQGDAGAQRNLGLCYEFGKGVEKDEKEAVRYYRLAAAQGHATGQTQLENLLKRNPHLKSVSHTYTPQFFPAAPQDATIKEPTVKSKKKSFIPKIENENCCVM